MREVQRPAIYSHFTVLLIGDTFGILKRIAFALQHRGCTVLWGDSAASGLRIAECEEPDLIVCEIDLPDLSGIEVCRRVKGSFFSDIPVVLVGKTSEERLDSGQAMRAGADDYLVSFSDSRLVIAKLLWLMERHAAQLGRFYADHAYGLSLQS